MAGSQRVERMLISALVIEDGHVLDDGGHRSG